MKLLQIISEANPGKRVLNDPKMAKMLSIAIMHDSSIPRHLIAKLGHAPNDEQLIDLWSKLVDDSLQGTDYGDVSSGGKFDDWIARRYINGQVDYEDINGEGGDALGAWRALSIRGKLKPQDQDFNKFKSLKQLQSRVLQNSYYQGELQRIKNAETLELHKRTKKELTLIDTERFIVSLPFNFGSCYSFNNAAGFNASFCTGSSKGEQWFGRYAMDGPIISIVDKENIDDVNGKWQIHAPTHQIKNGNQTINSDAKFAELFPGLLQQIAKSMSQHAEEIKQASSEIKTGGYDVEADIAMLKRVFPISWASTAEEEKPEEEPAQDDGPGSFEVRHIPTNRTAVISADSRQHLLQKLRDRYPQYPETDYEISRQGQ